MKNLQKRVQKFDFCRILSRRIKGKMHFSLNLLLQNLEDKRKMPVFASSKGEFAERMTTFMSSFVRPVGMLLVISFISGECFCSIECKSPHKLSMYLFYPLILHPLLIISELERNYPLIIRQLSYTKSKNREIFLLFCHFFIIFA